MERTEPITRAGEPSAPQSFAEKAMLNPDKVFAHPRDVLNDKRLSMAEKKKVLEVWADVETRLLDSSEEGMTPPVQSETVVPHKTSCLAEVKDAQRKLHELAN